MRSIGNKAEILPKALIKKLLGFPKLPSGNPSHAQHATNKSYVDAQVAAAQAAAINLTKRQVVVSGAANANNAPNYLGTGSGFQPQLLASTTNLIAAVANGFDATSGMPADVVVKKTADASFPAISANKTGAYLLVRDDGDLESWEGAYSDGFAPPASVGALCDFDSDRTDDIAGSDPWTAGGTPTIDTSVKKFGAGSLRLDTADKLTRTDLEISDGRPFIVDFWLYFQTTTSDDSIFSISVGAGNLLNFYRTGTSLRLNIGGTLSTASQTVTTGVWYNIRIEYDGAGNWAVYQDDIANGTVSSKTIGTGWTIQIGANAGDTFDGNIDDFAIAVTDTAVDHSTAFGVTDVIPDALWYNRVSGILQQGSSAAGWNDYPGIVIGETDTDGSAVTAVRPYAFNGVAVVETGALTNGTPVAKNHHIGSDEVKVSPYIEVLTAHGDFEIGDRIWTVPNNGANGLSVVNQGKTAVTFIPGATSLGSVADEADGTAHTLVAASCQAGAYCERAY